MNPISTAVSGAFRGLAKVADATTAAAGAVGGAAVNGVVGGLQGAANGARSGLTSGSHSSAAAALTLGAIGAAGLVEWPVVVAVGGTALVVHQLSRRGNRNGTVISLADNGSDAPASETTPQSSAGTAARRPAKTARKSTAPRRSPTK